METTRSLSENSLQPEAAIDTRGPPDQGEGRVRDPLASQRMAPRCYIRLN